MTYVGDWEQMPDYTAWGRQNFVETFNGNESTNDWSFVSQRVNGVNSYDPSIMNSVLSQACAGPNGNDQTPLILAINGNATSAPVAVGINYGGGFGDPLWTDYYAGAQYSALGGNAYGLLNRSPTMPLGAVGIEWEGGDSTGTVIQALLYLAFSVHDFDTSVNGPISNPSWTTTYFTADGGGFDGSLFVSWDGLQPGNMEYLFDVVNPDDVWTYSSSGAYWDLLEAFDVTDRTFGPYSNLVITSRHAVGNMQFAGAAHDGDGLGMGSSLTAWANGIKYTIRPPRHRFIYDRQPAEYRPTPNAVGHRESGSRRFER